MIEQSLHLTFKPKDEEWSTKVDALAARLGLEPVSDQTMADGQMRYLLAVNNGERYYNLFDMVMAVLDRIDAASK